MNPFAWSNRQMRRAPWLVFGLLALWIASCGDAIPSYRKGDKASAGNDGGSEDPGNDSPAVQLPDDETSVGLAIGDAGLPLLGPENACLSEVREAEGIDLDLFVMLDRSGSMIGQTGSLTKWGAVTAALSQFLDNPETAGIGVGLGVFPHTAETAPLNCLTDDDCGTFGPCVIEGQCPFVNPVTHYPITCSILAPCVHPEDPDADGYCKNAPEHACVAGTDCPGNEGACVDIACSDGLCEDDTGQQYACRVGTRCVRPNGSDLGDCEPRHGYCFGGDTCTSDSYAEPTVPITLGAERNDSIQQQLETIDPGGGTPTTPALQGALQYARDWKLDHPERAIAVILATDGFPSECIDTSAADPVGPVLTAARDGARATPPVRTYVVGVFSGDEATFGARDILNSMAKAGETDRAYLVDADGNVGDEFLLALQQISSTAIACEFQLAADEDIDFGTVNLRLTLGNGDEIQLGNIGDASNCEDKGEFGWYYEQSEDGGAPSRIRVCPQVCDLFAHTGRGRVDLQIGCATLLL